MTKRLKVYLLTGLAAICLACTVAGCKIGRPGRAELLRGYDSHITYYSNGGSFNDSETTTVMEIYYKAGDEGVPFFNVTTNTAKYGMKVERKDYDLRGWYEPVRYTAEEAAQYSGYVKENDIKFEITYTPDANGNISDSQDSVSGNTVTEPVFPLKNSSGGYITDNENDRPLFARADADGNLREEEIRESRVTAVCDETKLVAGFDENDNEVNSLTIRKNDVYDVCALWERSASISYHLIVTDENGNILADEEGAEPKYYNVTETDDNGEEQIVAKYKNEDQIDLRTMHGDSVIPLDMEPVAIDGLTFVRTYMDKELTERVHSIARPEDKNAVVDVYCRYIVGNWTVVAARKDIEIQSQYESRIRTMFNNLWNPDNKYLIIDDIDCTGFSAFPLKVSGMSSANARATLVVDGDKPLTFSNLSFTVNGSISQSMTYSIFGAIGAEFKVKGAGLIMKNTNISLPRANTSYYFYAICTGADAAAAPNVNLTIDTVTVTYQLAGSGSLNDGDLTGKNWLFGGNAAQFGGIKLAESDNSSITELRQE